MSSVSWAVLAEGPHLEKKALTCFWLSLLCTFSIVLFFYGTFLFFSLFLKKNLIYLMANENLLVVHINIFVRKFNWGMTCFIF